MKLYYAQGACSLAPHIILHELGLPFELVGVNLQTKNYKGGDFTKINPKGYVPTLQLDDGQILTEVQVILQYLADQKPEAQLLPRTGFERYQALEWLNYVATELHKGFGPLWKPHFPDEAKEMVKTNLMKSLGFVDQHLKGRDYLLGSRYSVGDAYLFTVTNWAKPLKVDLSPFADLGAWRARVAERPATKAALEAEGLRR